MENDLNNDEQEYPGYSAAMEELEGILSELEGDDPDVDELAAHVERAAFLIRTSRQRIRKTRLQVEEVVLSLDDDD